VVGLVGQLRDALKRIISILIELLTSLIGNLSEIQTTISGWLVKEVSLFSKDIKFSINDSLKGCFLCKLNPNIPNWMITEGVNIEISQIDFKDMFKIHPDSLGGRLIYGDNRDLNRVLFEAISQREKKVWYYNNRPIATFEFIEKDAYVGYDETQDYESFDNKGLQNTNKRNNVINMKIHTDYQNQSIVNFVNDYVNSLDPIIQAKKVVPNLMDINYGSIANLAKLSFDSIRKQVAFDLAIETLVNEGAEDEQYKIDNSFITFSDDNKGLIDKKATDKLNGEIEFETCCCGNSTVNTDTILSFNERIDKSTTEVEDITLTNNAITQLSNESTDSLPDDQKAKGYSEFIANLLSNLPTIIISMVFTPKINFIIVMLQYMVTKNARFISVTDFIKRIWCVIKPILFGILKKVIYNLLLPLILSNIIDLIKCSIKEKIKRKLLEETKQVKSLIPSLPNFNAKLEVVKALNGLVDTGFDSIGNNVQNNINNINDVN